MYEKTLLHTLTSFQIRLRAHRHDDGCTINGSNNTSATASLIKTNTGVLSLTNTTVTGHTVSTANVCAVDASSADGAHDVQIYSASIIGNTSNNRPANLKISGTNYMYIYNPLTQDIGITNTNNNYNDAQFGYSNPTTNIGVEHLINDITDMLTPTQSNHVLKWVADDSADPLDDMFGFPDYLIHDLKIYPTSSDLEAVPANALIGTNNENPSNPYMVWKSVSYNDDNSVDVTLNYFQKQVNLKLDFIFVIDESGTMGSHVSGNGYTLSQAQWARNAALEASRGVLQLNVDYSTNNNRVCFISWGGTTVRNSGFIDNFETAREAVAYNVIGGGTNHSLAISAATTAANQSASQGHATFTGCTANTDGGGVYAYSGLEIDGDATFTNCTATRNGGGIYAEYAACLLIHQYNPSNPSLTLENCHAGASGGGAYFKYGIHTTWDASSECENHPHGDGHDGRAAGSSGVAKGGSPDHPSG